MSAFYRIEIYPLGSHVMSLRLEGKSFERIAKTLTKELHGKDNISQPTVAKELKSNDDYIRDPRNIDDLKRLALDVIRVLNEFVQRC